MENGHEIVFFLDHTDIAIVEVEDRNSGFKEMLWFMYHKASHSIKRFRFRPSFATTKVSGQPAKKGFLKLSNRPGRYSIEIDHTIFDFDEQNPDFMSDDARTDILRYLNTAIV
jgi:hypothetical protein